MRKQPQIWGGVECTVNRVGPRYFNQLERSGHWQNAGDLELFAELGLRTLRFPLLWELLAPRSLDAIDWRWSDERLSILRRLGIRPIAGLLHHGSGPAYTSLIDPDFPEKLARYARAVAERYPWIDSYTPVNEPLTTARFSGLYGHWFPHGRTEEIFARAFLNQCRGTKLAMAEIRKVNPAARLVQTDDLARTHATPSLRYQAEFENERRWLTWDTLRGEIDPESRMWGHLRGAGIGERELMEFIDDPCSPDVIGMNYYVTSERYLDENVEDYPPQTHGDNGRERYADDEAVRARWEGIDGFEARMNEAWQRYHTSLALTEVHVGCSEDEQLRWWMEAWRAANVVQASGAEVEAVTAWALLGSFDWDSLVTEERGAYEPGVFDVSDGARQPRLLASAIRQLAQGHDFDHPLLIEQGWWRQPSRLRFGEIAA